MVLWRAIFQFLRLGLVRFPRRVDISEDGRQRRFAPDPIASHFQRHLDSLLLDKRLHVFGFVDSGVDRIRSD